MKREKIYILKAGSTYSSIYKKYGDFEDWIVDNINVDQKKILVIDIRKNLLPVNEELAGIIVTGSHAMVTNNYKWINNAKNWIRKIIQKNIPYLGICFGHQLLAKALGGRVDFHPDGEEIGTVKINLLNQADSDPIFSQLPKKFFAHTSHSQTVIRLPKIAIRLAKSSYDSTHAFRIGDNAWGVQFHPEFNVDIMKEYILKYGKTTKLNKQGLSFLLDTVRETPFAKEVLNLFVEYIMRKS